MFRKLLIFIMAMGVFSLYGASSVNASYPGGSCGNYVFWELNTDSGVLSITGSGDITDFYSGSQPWYALRSEIKTVLINEGITKIGRTSFSDCNNLTNISLPVSLIRIEGSAFSGCSALSYVYLPAGISSIGMYAFTRCSSLSTIALPAGISSIDEATFRGCSSLSSITILGNLTSIGRNAFEGCSALNGITIPGSVNTIDYAAFKDCIGLTSVTIPAGVTYVNGFSGGNGAFYGCTNLRNVTVQGNPIIGQGVFENCSSLESISLPLRNDIWLGYVFGAYNGTNQGYIPASLKTVVVTGNITNLYYGCFKDCSGIRNITIPSGVTSLPDYCFSGCTSLTSVTMQGTLTSIGYNSFAGCQGFTSFNVPDSVTTINQGAFSGCSGLSELTLPFIGYSRTVSGEESLFGYIFGYYDYAGSSATVQYYDEDNKSTFYIPTALKKVTVTDPSEINYGAFYGCTNIETVLLCEGVTTIGGSAFYGCTSLSNFSLPESVTTIGNYAFYGSDGIGNIFIPKNVSSIGKCAFYKDITVDENNTAFLSLDGVLFNKNKSILIQYPSGKESISYEIPDSVTGLGDSAFFGCINIETVYINKGVTEISDCCFFNCSVLKWVIIPESVTTFGDYVFYQSNNVKIYGKSPSNAKTYADNNGITFVPTVPAGGITLSPSASVIDDKIIITANSNCVLFDKAVYVALYSGGDLIDLVRVQAASIDEHNIYAEFKYIGAVNRVKVFIWDNSSLLKCLGSAAEAAVS